MIEISKFNHCIDINSQETLTHTIYLAVYHFFQLKYTYEELIKFCP